MRAVLLTTLLTSILLGCQADPGAKLIPFEDKKVVDKAYKATFNPAVDILFIIDDSASMNKFHKELSKNAKLFNDAFLNSKFIDYHIGVTTSSRRISDSKAPDGQLHVVQGYPFVDRNVKKGAEILAQMFEVGQSAASVEEFFSIQQLALSPHANQTVNFGFFRPHAQLAIFVVTDTEDQSGILAVEAFEFLLNLKGRDEKKLHFAAALANLAPNCDGENQEPEQLLEMIELHKSRGFKFDICANNYGEEMGKIAGSLVEAVSTIYLDELPDVTTIEVSFGNTVIPNDSETGWVYNAERNAIILAPNIDIVDPTLDKLNIKFESIYK